MENTVIQRIVEIIQRHNYTESSFAKRVGLNQKSLNQYLKGERKLSYKLIEAVISSFEDISPDWLMTGEGEMLKSKNADGIEKGALVYDIDATCGTSGRDINFVNEIPIGRIDIPNINPNSQVITATGDSMQPLINSGDKIVIRRIESWSYFNYGQVYLIITEDYRFIKRIRKHDNEREMIVLRSENDAYDDIVLPRESIKHLYVVENILSIKNIL